MRVASVISEYNPFHKGHEYHLTRTRQLTEADYVIVVMNGDFTQRGTPAIIDKYSRTEQALSGGADLVLELPVCFGTASAEGFAFGAVSLLEQLGVTDYLVFGSESGTLDTLKKTADFLTTESPEYRNLLQTLLKQGLSYPKARAEALKHFFPDLEPDFLSSPNNILGMEYCRALNSFSSSIIPLTIKRIHNLYHEETLAAQGKLSSATAIRKAMLKAVSEKEKGFEGLLTPHLPPDSLCILEKNLDIRTPVLSNDFSLLLKYRLCLEDRNSLVDFMDITPDLADRICNHLNHYRDFDSFCDLLKTKELTHNRIRRSLLHILLDLKGNGTDISKDNCPSPASAYSHYARILGFRREAAPLLHEIKKNASIPLISKLSDFVKEADPSALSMLKQDIRAAHIYESVVSDKFHQKFQNEFQRQIVIL